MRNLMSGPIPDSFIEELLARSDIVELIERRVPLKRVAVSSRPVVPFMMRKPRLLPSAPKSSFIIVSVVAPMAR